jgi:toxin ParE1/3/4
MPVKLIWSPRARGDAKIIYLEIGLDQPRVAERYLQNFRRKANLLRKHPRMGPRHPEISLAARALVESPYLILHETIPDTDEGRVDTVEIVRIVDGRRDVAGLLR